MDVPRGYERCHFVIYDLGAKTPLAQPLLQTGAARCGGEPLPRHGRSGSPTIARLHYLTLSDEGQDANGDVVVVQAAVSDINIFDIDERRAVASGYQVEFLIEQLDRV